MDVKIISEKQNPLLERSEIRARISFVGPTPSNSDVQNIFAARYGVAKDLVVVAKNHQRFGAQTSDVYVKIYKNERAMRVEPTVKKKSTKSETAADTKKSG